MPEAPPDHTPDWRCYKKGCRSIHCRREASARAYENRYKGKINPRVSAQEARLHLEYLASKGYGINAVAEVTGLAAFTIYNIRIGKRKNINRNTEDKILGAGTALFKPEHYDPRAAKYQKRRSGTVKLRSEKYLGLGGRKY